MTEVGTLKALGVKEGDVVEFVDADDNGYYGKMTVIKLGVIEGALFAGQINARMTNYGWGIFDQEKFRIISRASESPRKWGDMTDAERGALLLAKHEGKRLQYSKCGKEWLDDPCLLTDGWYFRVKPEPVRELVNLTGADFGNGDKVAYSFRQSGHIGEETHRITLETVDGKPDCASIKMEPIE